MYIKLYFPIQRFFVPQNVGTLVYVCFVPIILPAFIFQTGKTITVFANNHSVICIYYTCYNLYYRTTNMPEFLYTHWVIH